MVLIPARSTQNAKLDNPKMFGDRVFTADIDHSKLVAALNTKGAKVNHLVSIRYTALRCAYRATAAV